MATWVQNNVREKAAVESMLKVGKSKAVIIQKKRNAKKNLA